MADAAVLEPFRQVAGDVRGTVIAQQAWPMGKRGARAARCRESQFHCLRDILDFHRRAQLRWGPTSARSGRPPCSSWDCGWRDGATPWQALLAATRDGAAICGAGHELGTIEVGKLADLTVVGGNPLDDIQNVRQLKLVLKEGVVVSDKRE